MFNDNVFALQIADTTEAFEDNFAEVATNENAQQESTNSNSIDNQLTNALAALEAERISWETTVYRTSNQALYSVLAKCLALSHVESSEHAKKRNAALEAFFKQRGYRYKKDAHPASRIVKAVFGDIDRRRLSTYSLVLREAIKQGITASNLADWIEDRGGIQEIRLSQSKTFVKPSAKAEIAKQRFDSLPALAQVKSEALSELADADFMGDCCVLIAEQAADGSFIVRAVTRSTGAVNAAFTALYSEQNKAA